MIQTLKRRRGAMLFVTMLFGIMATSAQCEPACNDDWVVPSASSAHQTVAPR